VGISVLAAGVALGEGSRATVRFRSWGPTVTIGSSGSGGRAILLDVQADLSAERERCVEVDRDERHNLSSRVGCQGSREGGRDSFTARVTPRIVYGAILGAIDQP